MSRDKIVSEIIDNALLEDLSTVGDITSLSIFGEPKIVTAIIKVKESGVISGVSLISQVFHRIDEDVHVDLKATDGDSLKVGDVICAVTGSVVSVLSGERLVLNLLQRLSGIATATSKYVDAIKETSATLLDTRKTIPNLRVLEKEAVVHGGGANHRFGLFDMIMAKDTHVKAAGGPGKAVVCARKWCNDNGKSFKVEVEVESLVQFKEALAALPDRIMLDNMSIEDMVTAVGIRNSEAPLVELEASGNVSLMTIKSIAETGVDFISVGALTHSVIALDIHLILV